MFHRQAKFYTKLTVVVVVALGLATPLYFIPNAIGGSFTRASISITYLSVTAPTGSQTFRVLRDDNTIINVTGLAFSIQVYNVYFLPVVVSYRGPDLAVFVYNKAVDTPGDPARSADLKWQVTTSAGLSDEDNVRFPSSDDFAEHVITVPRGGTVFNLSDNSTTWSWAGSTVSPGTYYAYGMAFGRLTLPVLVRILSG